MIPDRPRSERWKTFVTLSLPLAILILLPFAAQFTGSSLLVGASLTILFSALYLLFARLIGPKGTRIFRLGGIVGLLLVSLVCAIPGLVFIHYSGFLDKTLLGYGLLLTFGGMIVGTIVFTVLANRFVKTEKRHFQESLQKGRIQTPLLQRKIKARASMIRMKDHPHRIILFCLVGWIVGVAMIAGSLEGDQTSGLMLMGFCIALAYTGALGWFFWVILRGKWKPTFDAAIQKLDLEIKRLEEESIASSQHPAAAPLDPRIR